MHAQTAEFLLSGTVGAGFVVSLAVLRIYLGWSYVGDRLLSAAVAYEETGWYDGQVNVCAVCCNAAVFHNLGEARQQWDC